MSYASKFEKILASLHTLPNYRETFTIPGFGKRTITANAADIKKLYDEKQHTRSTLARRITHHAGARFSMVSQDDERAALKRTLLKPHLTNEMFQRIVSFAVSNLEVSIDQESNHGDVEVLAVLQRSIARAMVVEMLGVKLSKNDQKLFNMIVDTKGKTRQEESIPRMIALNLIPFIPLFIKNIFAPHTKRTNEHAEKLVNFLYHNGIDVADGFASKLKDAEMFGIISRREVLGEYRAIFIGAKTLALSIMWTMYLLSKYPDKKEKIGTDQNYARLAYMESLRLLPPFFMLNYEKKKSKCPVHFWKRPEQVNVSVSNVHRIEEYWEKAHNFEPERFANGMSTIVKGSYIPFGGGERNCPGAGLSMIVGPAIVSEISRLYDFTLVKEPVMKRRVELTTADGKMFFKFQKKQGLINGNE